MRSFNFADMLTELKVKNYALIKDLLFVPGKEFNVITGETGAGKSILLGAMGLVLGERTDTVAIRDNEEKCVIEATFLIKDYALNDWFETNAFDYEQELILRREISTGGKSRAFINDTPAQLSQLKELGKFLVDIHSQHDNLDLFQKEFQFGILDSFSSAESLQNEYKKHFDLLKKIRTEISRLQESEFKALQERDFKQFQYDELVAAQLQQGEFEQLEEEQLSLSTVETSIQILEGVKHQLSDSENALIDQLSVIRNQLNQISKNDKRLQLLSERLNDAFFNLKDIGNEIDSLYASVHSDPARLEYVNQRLALLHNLTQKHKDMDLFLKKETLENELELYANLSDEILQLKQEEESVNVECHLKALELSRLRNEHAVQLESKINTEIVELGMPGASIKIELTKTKTDNLGNYGLDDTNILFSPAKGKLFNPIQNIASGGEISRVMLVLKMILAEKKILPTIIFDEIDTGVSGEVAFKMGKLLENMSKSRQLIVITHLPQIASKGKKHFFVFKKQMDQTTVTDIKELTSIERENEIAEMMGGKGFGESILESAKHLLNSK